MARSDPLADYRGKRHHGRTPEPEGAPRQKAQPGAEPRFVVQKHAARRLHYDFRLEVGGVLRSWAVPRGPSPDSRQKRLAVEVEDHPLEYSGFEGTIPGGEYGAGRVIVWDAGTYRNVTAHDGADVPIAEALERGHAVVELHGVKLRGRYALTRTGGRGGARRDDTGEHGAKDQWLLVKTRGGSEPGADPVVSEPASVLSGRTLDDLGDGA